ncbi:hypothetical protein N0V92_011504 [Colletotrichum tropicale]|nr:hypothetical protein N0V92_011504 [Colletotrichum tropicale]
MARIRKDKCVDISTLRKTSTATCLLELFEGVNTNRGEIRQHNLNSSKGSEVRLLFQSSDHLAYLMVRDHEIISIWPVMNKEGDFMGNKMRPLHSLTISANPERPSRQDKEGRVSPVQVNTLTNMKLTKNLVETLSRPNGIGEFMSTQYDINRKKRWRMTHAQHCHNVFLLFKRVRSFSEDLSARKSAIQVLNDYVVAMSFGRIFMRKESGFTDRNFGDILKMTVSQLEHKYASSTSTEKLSSIDEIPPVRGGTSSESRNNLTREEITIADPEHHALLKAILDLSPESTWDTSALNPANVDAAPGEPGGRSVAYYNRKGRRDFQGVCKALFEGIETSAEALNYAIEQPNIQAKEIFDAVRHFQYVGMLLSRLRSNLGHLWEAHLEWLMKVMHEETHATYKKKGRRSYHVDRPIHTPEGTVQTLSQRLSGSDYSPRPVSGQPSSAGSRGPPKESPLSQQYLPGMPGFKGGSSGASSKPPSAAMTPTHVVGSRTASGSVFSSPTSTDPSHPPPRFVIHDPFERLRQPQRGVGTTSTHNSPTSTPVAPPAMGPPPVPNPIRTAEYTGSPLPRGDFPAQEQLKGPKRLLQPTGGDPGNPTGPTQTGIDENPRHRSWAVTLDVWAGSLCRQVDAVRALTVKETDFDEFYNRVLRDVPLTFLETTFSFDDKANLLSYQTYLQGHRRKDGSLYTQAEQQAIMKEIQNLEVKRKMKTPRKGNLHAESITFVMHCIAVLWDEIVDESHTPSQDEDILDLPDKDLCFDFKNLPLILAVSKRCCPTCHHLLKICVERVKGTSLTYSGNHSDWWPVALPPWMPKDIAERLHSRIHADLTDRFEAILYPDRLPKTGPSGGSIPSLQHMNFPKQKDQAFALTFDRGQPAKFVVPEDADQRRRGQRGSSSGGGGRSGSGITAPTPPPPGGGRGPQSQQSSGGGGSDRPPRPPGGGRGPSGAFGGGGSRNTRPPDGGGRGQGPSGPQPPGGGRGPPSQPPGGGGRGQGPSGPQPPGGGRGTPSRPPGGGGRGQGPSGPQPPGGGGRGQGPSGPQPPSGGRPSWAQIAPSGGGSSSIRGGPGLPGSSVQKDKREASTEVPRHVEVPKKVPREKKDGDRKG